MDSLLEETWGNGYFQYRTLLINTIQLLSLQVSKTSVEKVLNFQQPDPIGPYPYLSVNTPPIRGYQYPGIFFYIFNIFPRNPKLAIENSNSKPRNRKLKIENSKSKTRNRKLEIENSKSKTRNR